MYDSDIGILLLSTPVTFTAEISPICLPSLGESVPTGQKCYSTGWGQLKGEYKQGTAKFIMSGRICRIWENEKIWVMLTPWLHCLWILMSNNIWQWCALCNAHVSIARHTVKYITTEEIARNVGLQIGTLLKAECLFSGNHCIWHYTKLMIVWNQTIII